MNMFSAEGIMLDNFKISVYKSAEPILKKNIRKIVVAFWE